MFSEEMIGFISLIIHWLINQRQILNYLQTFEIICIVTFWTAELLFACLIFYILLAIVTVANGSFVYVVRIPIYQLITRIVLKSEFIIHSIFTIIFFFFILFWIWLWHVLIIKFRLEGDNFYVRVDEACI